MLERKELFPLVGLNRQLIDEHRYNFRSLLSQKFSLMRGKRRDTPRGTDIRDNDEILT